MLWCTNIYPGESYLIGTIQPESRTLKDDSEESTTNLTIAVHNKVLVSLCMHACVYSVCLCACNGLTDANPSVLSIYCTSVLVGFL